MGKNAAHQAAKSARAPGGDEELPGANAGDGVDASFHTAAWHAARLAMNEVRRETFDEFKARKAVEESAANSQTAAQEAAEREYRLEMQREREAKLSRGKLGASGGVGKASKERRRSSSDKRDKKDRKDKKGKKEKKEKRSKERKSRQGSESPGPA